MLSSFPKFSTLENSNIDIFFIRGHVVALESSFFEILKTRIFSIFCSFPMFSTLDDSNFGIFFYPSLRGGAREHLLKFRKDLFSAFFVVFLCFRLLRIRVLAYFFIRDHVVALERIFKIL